jgi:DNA repair exonuclease SbcCD ATPase subunit
MSVHATSLEVENWMAFRGVHRIKLEPKVYALTAVRVDDKDSSNWAGKSALAEAFLFALTGYVNPGRKYDNADGWIHRGEPQGGVKIGLSNGMFIERSRKRGKSTQLVLHYGETVAKQDEAQKLIDEAVGLQEDDLLKTCFCVQREAAFLVRTGGATLDGVFGSWLRLGKLEEAQDRLD